MKKIACNTNALCVQQLSMNSKITFAASDIIETGREFTTWRFRTHADEYNCSYYEIWNQLSETAYTLARAYFHVYCINQEYCRNFPKGEYLLLHCDPIEDDPTHGIYKKNPHLHVKTAKQPLPHAHIALNLYSADQIYSSITDFEKTIDQLIEMLSKQIIDKIIEEEMKLK
ncbi:MAG: hypothetical protein LBK45_05345 [Tannerellaceae bacterium]|nr:hypothetical protein [Tannerellaceae bacterium]